MFHGRTKDMLKVGGENVAALEIEALVGSHPEVRLCQVVGCPDDRLVEVPAAFVELKTPGAVGEGDIIEFCKGKVAELQAAAPRPLRFGMADGRDQDSEIQASRPADRRTRARRERYDGLTAGGYRRPARRIGSLPSQLRAASRMYSKPFNSLPAGSITSRNGACSAIRA